MSTGRHRYAALVRGQEALSRSDQARQARQQREEILRQQESLLGTEAQREGFDGEYSSEVTPYTGRYSLDDPLLSTITAGRWGYKGLLGGTLDQAFGTTRDFGSYNEYAGSVVQEANSLMEQAQSAAQSGDFTQAQALREQAQGMIDTGLRGLGGLSASAVTFAENEEYAARAQLSSPMAQTVGEVVFQGREFLDPESDTSQRFRRSLTEEAERAITTETRQAARSMRDLSLGRGAARSAMAERAFAERTAEDAARARADVYSQASQFFETYSRDFAINSVGFAQAYLQNQAGIRDSFVSSITSLQTQASSFATGLAQLHAQFAAEDAAADAARKDYQRQALMAVGSIVLGAITGGIAGFLLPGITAAEGVFGGISAATGNTAVQEAAKGG